MGKDWLVILLLIVGGMLTTACGILPKDVDLGQLASQAALMVSEKGSDWLQKPEGQAYLEKLVKNYAPGLDPAMMGGGLASIGGALLLMIRNMVKGSAKESRKRGELHERINKIENGATK